jgi:hypothetical protein
VQEPPETCATPALRGGRESVADLRHNKQLNRFTLRTQPKVNTQRTLYCLVHNIEKLAKAGFAK